MKRLLKTFVLISSIVLTGCDFLSLPFSFSSSSTSEDLSQQEINIYYVNDTHGCFSRNDTNKEAGMAYLSSYFKDKKQKENAIILSGGDMFQGGLESNSTGGKIMAEAMNIAGFDAMALGNHELDWGEDVLEAAYDLMNFPIISCNTFYSDGVTRPSWIKPYQIVTKNNVKVGILGFAETNMGSSILTSIANQFSFPNPLPYLTQYAEELKNVHKCDLVVTVGHDPGYESNQDYQPTSFRDLTKNSSTTNKRYVDGMMFAHDHISKQGTLYGVPFIEAGCNGKYIGHLKYTLNKDTSGSYVIDTAFGEVNYSYSKATVADQNVVNLLDKYSALIIPGDTVIATLNRYYSKADFAELVCKAMCWFVNSNPTDFNNTTVYFGSHNVSGIRSVVYSGDLTYSALIKALPFDNALTLQKCTQSQINYLEDNDYYATYQCATPVYVGNVTNCVTISYIAEYSNSIQESYVEYQGFTAKTALIAYLQSEDFQG